MKLSHPDAPKRVIEPKAEHAVTYQSQGWVEVPEPEPKPEKSDPKK